MSLVDIWQTTPGQLADKHLQQIIAFAGDGKLKDGNITSIEFRAFIGLLPSSALARYATECLDAKFDDSGLALQDIVNQAGRRLGFQVTDGRYRGVRNDTGNDGLWISPDGEQIVVEVKTTDAYRIDLEKIAGYRRALIRQSDISEDRSSVLIVVGREDTGGLEAQIRGSRHAWDIRILSVDALFRLVSIREEIEGPAIARKISDILIPREYTRVDGIIDLVFAAAAEVREEFTGEEAESIDDQVASVTESKKARFKPVSFHDECINKVKLKTGQSFIKLSRSTYSTPGGDTAVICAVSREHHTSSGTGYWFVFHLHQRQNLKSYPNAFIALGCGSAETVLLIPFANFVNWLPGMNMTKNDEREYWHVQVIKDGNKFVLLQKSKLERIDISTYLIKSQHYDSVTS